MKRLFGLIGYPLGHSWSKKYFDKKFLERNIQNTEYQLFPIEKPREITELLKSNPSLRGLNVTIPHKTAILPFLDNIDHIAKEINAVNAIKINHFDGKLHTHGYNTDAHGFEKSISPFLEKYHKSAIILGTGGAAKAAAWVFKKKGIEFVFISRKPSGKLQYSYNSLNKDFINKHYIIVNATPLGMMPGILSYPPLPYHFLSPYHLLFDMVYNPPETNFLMKGSKYGCTILGGFEMFQNQAEKSWEIWNS